ncbi:Glucose--fructose oxidoreductase precursor [Lacunisphaera limnophila]|uniref:Glucose--fructose oxidoreductase n=2 Tax=Lacunisphaera limnophila TaxID=1838286 RepID=A0A1D8AVS4_9BACT|nr:Glucose--fructose oxidoreductase precursor [Lacunisphaera limnophila]
MPRHQHGIAVWGLGRHAINNVLPAVAAGPGFQLAGVCSRNQAVGAEVAQRFHCAAWNDAAAMLADPRVEVVYICTPVGVHLTHALQALEAGKHVICEKSLVCAPADAERLIRAADERGLVLCEALMFLHHPRTVELLAFLAQNMGGTVRSISADFLLPRLESPGYRASKALGGGAFWDVACYPVALATAVMQAAGAVAHASFAVDVDTGVDCSGSARLTWSSGASAQLNWGYGFAYRNHAVIVGVSHVVEIGRVFTKGNEALDFAIYDSRGQLLERRVSPSANSFACLLEDVRRAVDDPAGRRALYARAMTQADTMAGIRRHSTPNSPVSGLDSQDK